MEEWVDAIYKTESRRVLATLIRLLGDFDLAEEAMHDAFAAALVAWPRDGMPSNPHAWLISTGRFKAIDQIRRLSRFQHSLDDTVAALEDDVAVDRKNNRTATAEKALVAQLGRGRVLQRRESSARYQVLRWVSS